MDEKIKIVIVTVGNHWNNQEQVVLELEKISNQQHIVFSTNHEGPSLTACGFIDFLNSWIQQTGRDPESIRIDTPNQYESIPYKFLYPWPISHFLNSTTIKYELIPRLINADSRLFGLFVARYTSERNIMVKDMLQYRDQFLFSVMPNSDTDYSAPYTVTYDKDVLDIGSIDGKATLDLSDLTATTNSLLNYYDQFQIEIVSETITSGQSFFVTEKTVRPIVGSRPMMVFAAVDFLKNLQTLGFKTFDTLWCEDYDRYEGETRWNMIKQNISDVVRHGYDRERAQKIVDYNYHHLKDRFLTKNG